MSSKNPTQHSDRARKLFIRTALVTSSTVATLIGAQNLALLDTKQFQSANEDTPLVFDSVNGGNLSTEFTSPPIVTTEWILPTVTPMNQQQSILPTPTTTMTLQISAPSITILRRNGQPSQSVVSTQTDLAVVSMAGIQPPIPAQAVIASQPAIQPPVPSTLPDPDPIIIQQQVAPAIEQSQQVQQETVIVQQQPAPQTTRSSR